MDETMMFVLITVGVVALIGALILQWFHKLGFKLAKVETSQIPGFSKRFLIQIAAYLVGYGVLYLGGELFSVAASDKDLAADAMVLIANFTTAITNNIGNIYIAMLIMTLIMTILYWVELLIAGKLLVSHLTVKTHLVAAIPPVVVVLLLSALPSILAINI